MSKPIVSICMITYNHEKFIKEAIYSVLNQKVDFELELIIVNDNSTDATDEIVKNIIHTHPKGSLINYSCNPKNLGMMPNFIKALSFCTGKYIAICEGDDYWIDTLKLQKQVSFMEKNQDYSICCSNAEKIGQLNSGKLFNSKNKTIDIYNFLNQTNPIATCTVLFNANVLKDYKFLESYVFGDWALWAHLLANSKTSKAYYSDEVTAVYRIHDAGVFNSLNEIQKLKHKKSNFIRFNSFFPEYIQQTKAILTELNTKIIKLYLKSEHKYLGFMTYLKTNNTLKLKTVIKLLMKS